jgi:ribonuclease PH
MEPCCHLIVSRYFFMMRLDQRKPNELRQVFLGPGFAKFADGSCFVKFGDTHVLCTATVEDRVPHFLRNSGTGWIVAEYGMLPRSSRDRIDREAVKGRQTGRTQEIQRLIGRVLRTIVDLKVIGERSIKIDCDVLQADGGTRTAAITGSYIALHQACQKLLHQKRVSQFPLRDQIAAISCGIIDDKPLLDLNYIEDSQADVDSNFIMTERGLLVEIQSSGEKAPFKEQTFFDMFSLAKQGISELITLQKNALKI